MILTATLYALLETLMQLILEGAILIAQLMLNATVTVFTDGQNIFDTFCNLIFPDTSPLPAVVKGIAYGVILLCIFLTTIRGFVSPLTGDDEISPWQAILRGVATILIMLIVFGFNFGGSIHYNGLISSIGEWFGTILQYMGGADDAFKFSAASLLSWIKDPFTYIADLVLIVSILVGVFGATIQYLERIVAFAVTYAIGPLAVSLYANKDTADTAKQWAMSIFTQFIAILLSLFLWNVFLIKLHDAFEVGFDIVGSTSVFNFGICIAILGLMKNSEKILNSFGLRTMTLGDAARTLTGGLAAIGSAAMIGSRAYQIFGGRGGGRGPKPTEVGMDGTSEPIYDGAGNMNAGKDNLNSKLFGTGNFGGFITSWKPPKYVKEHKAEYAARQSLINSESNAPVSADDINTSFGWNSGSTTYADGGASNMFTPVNYQSDTFAREADGTIAFDDDGNAKYETVQGWMGDVQYNERGTSTRLEDAVIVKNGANFTIRPGQSAGVGSNGNERVFTGDGPIITPQGQKIYKTREVPKKETSNSDAGNDTQHNQSIFILPKKEVSNTKKYKGNTEYKDKNNK